MSDGWQVPKVQEAVNAVKSEPQKFVIVSFMTDESSFKLKPKEEAPQAAGLA